MKLCFVWPAARQPLTLGENLTEQQAALLDVASGSFGCRNGEVGQDSIAFYWHMTRPVMRNLCVSHICRLDGAELEYGCVRPLRHDNQIQAGHFKLEVRASADDRADEQAFYQLIYPESHRAKAYKPPEVEEILPNGGNYINDLRYFSEVVLAQDNGDDVLKSLEVEYKRFLIWQELDDGYYQGRGQQHNPILRQDRRFERIREQIKGKTLTECIVDRAFLMEKVWPELECGEAPDELFAVEEKTEILKSLSPEHSAAKNKYKVPELVFRDFYKVGLDSHY